MITYELWIYNQGKNPALAYKSDEPDDYPIFGLKYKIEVNKTGSASFTIGVTHPLYDDISEMNTFFSIVVRYIKNGNVEHIYCPLAGRVLEISEDAIGNREVTCEGALGTLNDTFDRTHDVIEFVYSYYRDNPSDNYEDVYTNTAIRQIFQTHGSMHSSSNQYAGIDYWKTSGYRSEDYEYRIFRRAVDFPINIENITSAPDYGTCIKDVIEGEDDNNDYSAKSMYELLFNNVLKKSGGFILPVYDPFIPHVTSVGQYSTEDTTTVRRVTCLWTYKHYKMEDYSGTNLSGLVNYPNEIDGQLDFDRTSWLPHFTKGYNVVNLSKETVIKTKFNAVFPVGKNGPVNGGMVTTSTTPYTDILPIVVTFSDLEYGSDLRDRAQEWLKTHSRDSSLPKKYTITGPEPCGVGCGNKLIMLMRDVIIREDPSENLINSLVLPCLSMEIDVQNPQNNVYVISPFVDDNYMETTISSK